MANSTSNKVAESVRGGITLGSALAVAISWSLHESIIWAIIHGMLSWVYVLYYAIFY